MLLESKVVPESRRSHSRQDNYLGVKWEISVISGELLVRNSRASDIGAGLS